MSKTIGVFDSGIGGLSTANAIQLALPDTNVIFKNDSIHVPYGTKTNDELLTLSLPLLQDLAQISDIVVIACNTLSTNLIDEIREELPVPVIGVEPLIDRAAAYTKTGIIGVCATPRTLESDRYAKLKEEHAQDLLVIEPDCSDWSIMIEKYEIDHKKIRKIVKQMCKNQVDVIVLGCTHYHWISEEINKTAAKYHTRLIYPEEVVIDRIKEELAALQA